MNIWGHIFSASHLLTHKQSFSFFFHCFCACCHAKEIHVVVFMYVYEIRRRRRKIIMRSYKYMIHDIMNTLYNEYTCILVCIDPFSRAFVCENMSEMKEKKISQQFGT